MNTFHLLIAMIISPGLYNAQHMEDLEIAFQALFLRPLISAHSLF